MSIFDFLNKKSNKNLNFTFKSLDHLRYEHGKHISGPHGGAGRAVKIEPNISGGKGYSVTIYNLDGPHPTWQNNVQMSPKQMEIITEVENKVVLRGYGRDSTGASFADYGLTIFYQNGEPNKCVLHMHDRGVDIEYLPFVNSQSTPKPTAQLGKIEVNSKILIVGLQLIEMLIEDCDEDDAYVARTSLQNDVKINYNFEPTNEDIENAIFLINSIFPAHKNIVKETIARGFQVFYFSSFDITSLNHVRNAIKKALHKS